MKVLLIMIVTAQSATGGTGVDTDKTLFNDMEECAQVKEFLEDIYPIELPRGVKVNLQCVPFSSKTSE
jgi:hypothetical protein